MTREIKFRAWDTERKIMTEDFGLKDFDGDYFIPDGVNLVFDRERKNAELMQYTGLLDRNGKEIYEGDILKITDENTPGTVIWDAHLAAYYIQWVGEGVADRLCDYRQHNTPEIIGNVYETPNLLAN
jgi:uncharacterized phage protein (TIGR01671 family)